MKEIKSEQEMRLFGQHIGELLRGGEVIELVGDVGAGKTTLVRGIAKGMKIDETVQSPSFTVNRLYATPSELELSHYDFYRLNDAGIMADELSDTLDKSNTTTILEWSDTVKNILPGDRLTIIITATGENKRNLEIRHGGKNSQKLAEAI